MVEKRWEHWSSWTVKRRRRERRKTAPLSEQSVNNLLPNTPIVHDLTRAKGTKNQQDREPRRPYEPGGRTFECWAHQVHSGLILTKSTARQEVQKELLSMDALSTLSAQFLRERRYLQNVTPKTLTWYQTALTP